ncbi:MAG TPA: RHS repeat-associated core domain-containing protein [Terriglobales bacterium]|nr:RHS repeat-associated core domain-containing protein [Terriglobales bacterium]
MLHQLNGVTLDGASYAYDAAGNRLSKTEQASQVTSNYAYAPIYQLLQVTQGATTTESYSYDLVGNRLSSLGVSPYVYNSSNQLTSTPTATYTYDANGSTKTKVDATGTTTYNWDYENRLSSVQLPEGGGTVSFKYDPFGRRVQKSGPGGTVNYLYDGPNAIEEVDSAGNVLARYTQAPRVDRLLSMLRAGITSYYEQDGVNSVTSLSNSAGALAQTYTFDSFGKQTASSGSLTNPFQFTGREFDTETAIYEYRVRYYDPNVGRFLREDPIKFWAGSNFYSYVRNNPVDFLDPFGLKGTPWWDWSGWDHVPGVHYTKCWIWGLSCGKTTLEKKRQQIANPAADSSEAYTNDDLANPTDDEKRRIHQCAGNDDNCSRYWGECADVALAPIGDGAFPK